MKPQPVGLSDALSKFLNDNPDLPQGEQTIVETEPVKRKLGKLVITYERKGRGGKPATIIEGFDTAVSNDEIDDIARKLRQRLATGGSSRGRQILLQGDCRDKARNILNTL